MNNEKIPMDIDKSKVLKFSNRQDVASDRRGPAMPILPLQKKCLQTNSVGSSKSEKIILIYFCTQMKYRVNNLDILRISQSFDHHN